MIINVLTLVIVIICFGLIIYTLQSIKDKIKQDKEDKEGYKNFLNLIHNEQVYQAEQIKKVQNQNKELIKRLICKLK